MIEIKLGVLIKEANQYHYKTVKSKIIKLLKGSKEVSTLGPGGSMSIETSLDMAIGKADALGGCVASHIGKLPEITQTIKIKHALFQEISIQTGIQKIEPIKASEMLMLSINTSMTVGIVKRIKKDELELSLKIPIVPFKGDNMGIARNINNHWRLIGHGEVL